MAIPDESQKIPLGEKLGYALGDFASNLFWMPFVLFGPYYYTDVFGISATAVGVMLLVARVFDTANDPLMGLYADRSPIVAGLGRYRPFLRRFAIPFGFIGALAFFTPNVSPGLKLLYAWVTYTLFGVIYTAINIPYSALMSVLSTDASERASVSSFRMVGAQVAGLLVSSGLLYFVTLVGGGTGQVEQQRGFFIVMGVLALLSIGLWYGAAQTTRERALDPAIPPGAVKEDLAAILGSPVWWLLFVISFFTIAAFTLRFGVAAYYFKYYADPAAVAAFSLYEGGAISAFFTLNTIASLLGVFSYSFFASRIDKKILFLVLAVAAGLLSLRFYFIVPADVAGIVFTQAVFGFLTAPLGALLFAMYTDISVYLKAETGVSASGLVMSAGSFAQKFGWAIGGALTGLLLGWAGYVPDQPQSEQVRDIMRFMMSFAPAICCAVGAGLMIVYPLGDRKMRELAARETSGE